MDGKRIVKIGRFAISYIFHSKPNALENEMCTYNIKVP